MARKRKRGKQVKPIARFPGRCEVLGRITRHRTVKTSSKDWPPGASYSFSKDDKAYIFSETPKRGMSYGTEKKWALKIPTFTSEMAVLLDLNNKNVYLERAHGNHKKSLLMLVNPLKL